MLKFGSRCAPISLGWSSGERKQAPRQFEIATQKTAGPRANRAGRQSKDLVNAVTNIPSSISAQDSEYDSSDDFGRSIEFAYEAIRRRAKQGGRGWSGYAHCPCCRQPIATARFGVHLPALKAGILDAIKAAGDVGITSAELIGGDLYRDRKRVRPSAIKAHVNQINDALDGSGWRIASDRRRWALVRK